MIATVSQLDLAGNQYSNPDYLKNRQRINYLVERYLSVNILSDCLLDLCQQFIGVEEKLQPKPNSVKGYQSTSKNSA